MTKENFVGTRITPLCEFWIDCYSTAIFSILLSNCNIRREYIYENRYIYKYDINESKNLGRVYVKMQIDGLVEGLLVQREEYDFTKEEDFIGVMKKCFDEGKIVMLGIDMFYGVSDTLQWKKHHIRHYILVEGYDEAAKEFYIMETGESGYMEYVMSYEELELAARNFNDVSYAYSINRQFTDTVCDLDTVRNNAWKTVASIDEVLEHINDIWYVEEKYILSMRDEIDTHLKSMANRQRANSLLFSVREVAEDFPDHAMHFKELEKKFFIFRSYVLEKCTQGQYYEVEMKIKEEFKSLLEQEKELWEKVCEYSYQEIGEQKK